MKKIAMVIGLSAYLLSLLLAAGVTQAKDLDRQSELLRSCLRYEQNLTMPKSAPADQKVLLALTLASAETGIYDAADWIAVHRQAGTRTTYLVQSDTFYLWSTDHWEGNHRSTYTYSGTRRTGDVEQTLDSDSASWVNANQTLNTYNGDGTSNTMTQQEWQTDHWDNVSLISFTYSGGMTATMLMQNWSGSAWVNYYRSTLSYSGGNLATVITEMWQTSAWVNAAKSSYTYSGGHLTEWIMQFWVSSAWVNSTRGTFTYNGSGWETQSMMYNWQGSVWVNSSKYDYTYDGSGNEILDVFSLAAGPSWIAMEADTSKWSGGKNTEIVHNHMIPPSVTRTQFTYDGNGNMTVDLGQNWSGSAWVNSDRAVYVYQAALAVSCGDVDASGSVDIADVVYLIAYIFSGGAAPNPLAAGDVDCSGEINIADIVYLINYIFRGGAAPCNACP